MFFKRRKKLKNNFPERSKELNHGKVNIENVILKDNILQDSSKTTILNIILTFVLVSGEYSHDFIKRRLRDLFPDVKRENIDRCYKYCTALRDDIFKMIDQMYLSKVDDKEVKSIISERYPFLNDENYTQLFSQGQFLSWMKHYGNLL